jgi:hypothetical protein
VRREGCERELSSDYKVCVFFFLEALVISFCNMCDLVQRRVQNLALETYTPSTCYLSALGWKRVNTGSNLVTKATGADLVSIVVGCVREYRFNCGPTGSFNAKFGTGLEKAKYEFVIGRPDNTVFATDYDTAVQNLTKASQTVCSTQDQRYFILQEVAKEQDLRFVANVFTSRVSFVFLFFFFHHVFCTEVRFDRT